MRLSSSPVGPPWYSFDRTFTFVWIGGACILLSAAAMYAYALFP